MKTYLFDTINRFKRFSKQLDVKTIICDKAWQVFNDSGEKELYIFNTDGTVLITLNGVVTHGTWQFIAANDSLIITAANQSYMVHPAFLDDCLFALQVDGTDQVAFLIDQKNSQSFAPKTYQQVIDYFAGKEKQEQLLIERKRKQEEEERTRKAEELRRKAEQDRRLREQEENRKREKAEKERSKKEIEPILQQIERKKNALFITIWCISAVLLEIIICLSVFDDSFDERYWDWTGYLCVIGFGPFLGFFIGLFTILETDARNNKITRKLCQKYINEHPDDPRNAYLKQYIETELK